MERRIKFYLKMVQWIGIYFLFLIFPLIVALIGHDERWRGFWIEFGTGLGFIGLSMMLGQFILTGRFKRVGAFFGADAVVQVHRYAGIISYCLILCHILILILADAEYISFFNPKENAPRAVSLILATIGLTVVLVTSLWRKELGLSYEWWLIIHGTVSSLVVLVGLAHLTMVGYYITELWQQTIMFLLTGVSLYLIFHLRIVRPHFMRKKPYKVVKLQEESKDTWTVEIEADGHDGLEFISGQYARLLIGKSLLNSEQNPYTIASSDQSSTKLSFTIKVMGDFGEKVKALSSGDTIYLDAPYGSFTPKMGPDVSMFFVAGGIGVTPFMSMLRSFADKDDSREIVLIYANESEEDTAFVEELEALKRKLNLEVVHVMETPSKVLQSESGRVNGEMLKKHHPKSSKDTYYYVCGPEPLMDIAETTFLEWGVATRKIYSERFEIV